MGTRIVVVAVALSAGLALPAKAGERAVCVAERACPPDVFRRGVEWRRWMFQPSSLDPAPPAVVLPDPGPAHAAELDQAIERLGRLIREAERQQAAPR